ncbi:imidazole glycerol phosphate synthase subunit HisH [Neisseria leonii]|uniref:imidazole glycerol phosphate synthase subunit HisH n=1 Tax=Neisseria leonii TaxID=2995413 RepID=UPI00237C22FA|nr:imidazole glycerol phosphate synthase subunit HisH [Neisseria sp. 3986]MDD9325805.1 imidazole glycerol phosphate synthase subunit HisH [Neisseria sp. 3986]
MKVAVVDYGMGNLHSVFKSVQAARQNAGLQADIILTARAEDVASADKIVFPGQGAMPDCMAALSRSGLGEALTEGLKNKPFFGICVGAQLLFERSEEGDTDGLAWFGGQVKRFAAGLADGAGNKLKVPHMGWNRVRQTRPHPLFDGIGDGERFYFVHSYYFAPQDARIVVGESDYPEPFACAVARDNVFATQFHTEKSHLAGLRLLQNFLNWRP